jgi:hypothetical protein
VAEPQAEEDARADAALALKRKRELDTLRMQQLMPAAPVPHSARQASSMPASGTHFLREREESFNSHPGQ